MSSLRSWLGPRREWHGRNALVPLDTCHRILDLCLWSFAGMGTLAVLSIGLQNREFAGRFWGYWFCAAVIALQWIAVVGRGLPFLLRYVVFAGGLTLFIFTSTSVLGVTPNWALLLILLLGSTGLFFGTRMGLLASAVLCAGHLVLAWGWTTGHLPLAGVDPARVSNYLDFRLPEVWARVIILSAGLLAALQWLMSYVLRDTSRALAKANAAVGMLRDEQARREKSEAKFTAIFDQSPDLCVLSRVQDDVILDVNRAFEELTGWSRADAVGKPTTGVGFWPDPAERERVVREALAQGQVTGWEVTWIKRTGEIRAGLLSLRPMKIDGEDVLNISIQDVTERRRRERAVQSFTAFASRETGREFFSATVRYLANELGVRYALVVEVVTGADGAAAGRTLAAWADGAEVDLTYSLPGTPCENVVAQGLCHYADEVAARFPRDELLVQMGARSYVGLPIRDHQGRTIGLVAVLDNKPMPDAEAASVLLVLVAARATAEFQRLQNEKQIVALNADLESRVRERTAELGARVAEVERLNRELHGLMRDLQVSQQAADRSAARVQETNANLLAANQALEAFSYSISHDLRAPLRNMAGFLELLKARTGGALDAESGRFVAVLETEAQRMGFLIDDLLTFSQVGRAEMRLQNFELRPLVEEVWKGLETDTGDRGIEWQIGELPAVRADRALLTQVVANLLDNAVKFTRRTAAARIEIGTRPAVREERLVTVFVRDNGAGFNPKYLDKLFGVFQRLHSSRDFEGTGIGLANVKRIVTRHGGRVWAEGQVDRGATFYFTIPAAES